MSDFKRLTVTAKAHSLVLSVYGVTASFPTSERFGLISQMRGSASSIPMNVAEGCGRRTDPELSRFVRLARGSASELEYQLLLARDLGYLSRERWQSLTDDLDEVGRLLQGLLRAVERRQPPSRRGIGGR